MTKRPVLIKINCCEAVAFSCFIYFGSSCHPHPHSTAGKRRHISALQSFHRSIIINLPPIFPDKDFHPMKNVSLCPSTTNAHVLGAIKSCVPLNAYFKKRFFFSVFAKKLMCYLLIRQCFLYNNRFFLFKPTYFLCSRFTQTHANIPHI